jgi:hypothetical protein
VAPKPRDLPKAARPAARLAWSAAPPHALKPLETGVTCRGRVLASDAKGARIAIGPETAGILPADRSGRPVGLTPGQVIAVLVKSIAPDGSITLAPAQFAPRAASLPVRPRPRRSSDGIGAAGTLRRGSRT